jgi:hypothetical protein
MNTTTIRTIGLSIAAGAFAASSFLVAPAADAVSATASVGHSTHATANKKKPTDKRPASKTPQKRQSAGRGGTTPPTHRPPVPYVHGGMYKSYP